MRHNAPGHRDRVPVLAMRGPGRLIGLLGMAGTEVVSSARQLMFVDALAPMIVVGLLLNLSPCHSR